MDEIWKDVPGWEGFYQVSNLGRVKSIDRFVSYHGINKIQQYPSKILAQKFNTVGYYQVSLSKNNYRRRYMVHRLVALVFCENAEDKKVVNHIDGSYVNNKSCNLEWLTITENVRHAIVTGLTNAYGENSSTSKFSNEQVEAIRVAKFLGVTTRELTAELGVHKSTINRICNGKTYNKNNRIASYKNEPLAAL